MILIKGDRVAFATDRAPDPKEPDLFLPARYGMIHDPQGKQLPRCEVYFGPYRTVKGSLVLTREAKGYFGGGYRATPIAVQRPSNAWHSVARVVRIFYVRKGLRAPGGYHHEFRRAPLALDKSGSFYRLSLGSGCLIDDRGFVFP